MFASEEEVFASGEEGLPHPVCGLRTYFLQTDIPFFPYIPHLHLFIFHFLSHRWGLFPICTFFTRLSSHLRFQNWFLIMCVWYVCKIVTKKKMTKLLDVATILTVLTDSSSFVMLHPTSFVCTLWNGESMCTDLLEIFLSFRGYLVRRPSQQHGTNWWSCPQISRIQSCQLQLLQKVLLLRIHLPITRFAHPLHPVVEILCNCSATNAVRTA